MVIENFPPSVGSHHSKFAHANAVMPLGDKAVMVCFLHIDLVAVIDRSTGAFRYQRHDPDWGCRQFSTVGKRQLSTVLQPQRQVTAWIGGARKGSRDRRFQVGKPRKADTFLRKPF